MKKTLKILVITGICVLSSSLAFCEEEAEKKQELPQSGVLSATGTTGSGLTSVAGVWGDESGFASGAGSPVGGSVVRKSPGIWLVKVFNNSEDKYRLNLKLVQNNSKNRSIKTDRFVYTLKAEKSVEREVKAHLSSVHAVLELVSWNSYKKPEAEDKKEEADKEAEAADTASEWGMPQPEQVEEPFRVETMR